MEYLRQVFDENFDDNGAPRVKTARRVRVSRQQGTGEALKRIGMYRGGRAEALTNALGIKSPSGRSSAKFKVKS